MRVAGVITLDGAPESVRRARGLAEAVSLASLRDDVALVISELTSNARLHGRPPVTIRVLEREDRVRVEVIDTGNSLPVRPRPSEEAMTGRGLRLVGALSQRWGVEPLPEGGKTVWAELCPGEAGEPYAITDDGLDLLLAELASADEAARSEQLHTVHLGAVPTEFLLAAKSHIDDVVRELELVSSQAGTTGEPLPDPVRLLIEAVTREFAPARAAIKRQAIESAARGELVTELTLQLPLSAADAGERYLAALDEIDRQSRSARMLTLAPPRSHVAFRRWYLRGLIDQLRAAAGGEALQPPEPFPQVLADQVDELAALLETQTRLRLLQSITRRLTEARSVDEMAAIVADLASTYDGVRSVRILLRTDHATLKSVAWHGGPAGAVADEISLDAEFPVAVAARTGERLHARTLTDVYRRFPALEAAGLYSEDRSFHAVPLTIAGNVIGVLTVTFRVGDVTDDAQQDFVTATADVLAQAIERSLATVRADSERRRELALVSAQTTALAKIIAGTGLGTVLDGLLPALEAASTDDLLTSVLLVDDAGRNRRYGKGTGARASWSAPIVDLNGELLGTFAAYYRQTHPPSAADAAFFDVVVKTIALIVERSRANAVQPGPGQGEAGAQRLAHELAVSAGGVGTFDWDLVTGELVGTRNCWKYSALTGTTAKRSRSRFSSAACIPMIRSEYAGCWMPPLPPLVTTMRSTASCCRMALPVGSWLAVEPSRAVKVQRSGCSAPRRTPRPAGMPGSVSPEFWMPCPRRSSSSTPNGDLPSSTVRPNASSAGPARTCLVAPSGRRSRRRWAPISISSTGTPCGHRSAGCFRRLLPGTLERVVRGTGLAQP